MISGPIISTNELERLLDQPDWAIVDCRFDLAHPNWGRQVFLEAHIPNAVFADLNRDLSAPISQSTGRHPLPDANKFREVLEKLGISNSSKIVIYDSNGGAFAARLWWMLLMVGHNPVYVLDGGFPKWQRENKPVESGDNQASPGLYKISPYAPSMYCTTTDVLSLTNNPEYLIVDSRSSERYRGENEPIDPVAGHIPNAVNRFHGQNLTDNGVFKSTAILREEFFSLYQNTPPENVIFYCGSGVTSCHQLLATRIAGLPDGRVYIGSWSEWIRDPNRPIITDSKSAG